MSHSSANPNRPPTSAHSTSTSSSTHARNRQYTHLQSQLAQLNAHLADTENLLAMTAVQAEYLRGLGGWWGGLFMSASKVLGEEGNHSTAATTTNAGAGAGAAAGASKEGGGSAAGVK